MIGDDDILDPARNFSQPINQPFGIRIPDVVFRQLLSYSLQRLSATVDVEPSVIDELFVQLGDDVRKQFKGWLRDRKNIKVTLGYPQGDLSFPLICVVNQGEAGKPEGTFMGDRAGVARKVLANGVATEIEKRSIMEAHVRDIFIVTQDVHLTMMLYYLIKFILMLNSDPLAEFYDIQNLQISGQDVRHEASLFPEFCYVKMVRLSYDTYFDFNVTQAALAITSIGSIIGIDGVESGLLVDVDRDGITTPVAVPSDDE